MKGECPIASKVKRTYVYLTKPLFMPDGTLEEVDEKLLHAQILVKSGVDNCRNETFGHFIRGTAAWTVPAPGITAGAAAAGMMAAAGKGLGKVLMVIDDFPDACR